MGPLEMVKSQIQQLKKPQQLHIQHKQVAVIVQLRQMSNRHTTKQKGGKASMGNRV